MLNILTELKLDHFFWWDWIEIVLNLLFGTQWQFLKQFKFFLRQSNFTWIEWNSFKLRSNVYILNHNSFLLKKCQKALVIHGKRSYIQIYPFLWFFVVEKWIKRPFALTNTNVFVCKNVWRNQEGFHMFESFHRRYLIYIATCCNIEHKK